MVEVLTFIGGRAPWSDCVSSRSSGFRFYAADTGAFIESLVQATNKASCPGISSSGFLASTNTSKTHPA